MDDLSFKISIRNVSQTKVSWLALFFDLSYVIAVGTFGHSIQSDWGVFEFLRFFVAFLAFLEIWFGFTIFDSKFVGGGLTKKILVVVQMLSLMFMAGTFHDFLSGNHIVFISFYLLAKAAILSLYLLAYWQISSARKKIRIYILVFTNGIVTLLPALFIPHETTILVLIAVNVVVNPIIPYIVGLPRRFFIQPNQEFLTERFALFTTLVFAETLSPTVRIIDSSEISIGLIAYSSIFVFLSFILWISYFENQTIANLRKNIRWGQIWTVLHIPIWFGVLIYGRGIEQELIFLLESEVGPEANRILLLWPIAAIFIVFAAFDAMNYLNKKGTQMESIKVIVSLLIAASALSMSANNDISIFVVVSVISVFALMKMFIDIYINES